MVKWINDITQQSQHSANVLPAGDAPVLPADHDTKMPSIDTDARSLVTRDEIAQLFARDLGYTAR